MPEAIDLRSLNSQQLAGFGLEQIAYIKKVELAQGLTGFGIFSADGRPVAVAETVEMAQAVIRQHELEPVHIH
ncbi:MAG: DUF1150 family protein [Reyranellaceae bacterium]